MADDSNPRELIASIMGDTRVAVLTYTDETGRLVSLPMGTQDFDDPGTVYFITESSSDKIRCIQASPQVNVHYPSGNGWVSLSGTGKLNTDRAKLEELWDPSRSAFMSGGPDDPDSAILEVSADTAEYWEAPGKATLVVQLVKGLVTDAQPDLGDNDIVQL